MVTSPEGWVTAMVCGNNQQFIFSQQFQYSAQVSINLLYSFTIAHRIPSMSEIHICVHIIDKYELITIGPMSIIRDNVTTKGITKIYIEGRFGGRLVDNNSLKVLSA